MTFFEHLTEASHLSVEQKKAEGKTITFGTKIQINSTMNIIQQLYKKHSLLPKL